MRNEAIINVGLARFDKNHDCLVLNKNRFFGQKSDLKNLNQIFENSYSSCFIFKLSLYFEV